MNLFNQIRAFNPWPVCETILGKEALKIYEAVPAESSDKKPGTIVTDGKTLKVVCGDQKLLSLVEVQLPNKKRMKVGEFLKGFQNNFPFSRMGRHE